MAGESSPIGRPEGVRGVSRGSRTSAEDELRADETTDDRDDLETALDELGAGAAETIVYVSKWNADSNARHGFDLCGKYAAEGFDPYRVPRDFGAGRFKFQFRQGPRYVRNIIRSFILPASPAAAPSQTPPASALEELQRESRETRAFERQMLLTILASTVGKPAAAPAPGSGSSFADMLAVFSAGREAASAAPTPLDAIREAIALGRELSGSTGPGGEDDEPRARRSPSLIDRFGDRALGLVELALTRPAPPAPTGAPTPPALAAGATPNPAQAPAARPVAPVDPAAAFLKQFAPGLLEEARAGHDPRSFGAHIAERCPDAYADHLAAFAEATPDERLGFLATHAPELVSYSDWITDACAGVLEVFEPEDDDTTGEDDRGAA